MRSPFNMTVSKLYGLSPLKQEDDDTGGSAGEQIADFITPESVGEAILSVFPVGGKGISKWITKSKAGKQLLNKFPGLGKLFTKTKIQKNQPFDFSGKRDFSGKAKQMQVGDVKWKKDLHVGNKIKDVEKVAEFKLNEMRSIGKNLDDIGFDATKLTTKDVKFRGVIGKRSVVEVKLPNGETQLFYKSTDFSGKGVEDMWQPYAGHMNLPGNDNWFIKDLSKKHATELYAKGQQPLIPNVMGKSEGGFKEFYNSKSFRDISGNLDRIAVEGGFQKHITKGQGYASKR